MHTIVPATRKIALDKLPEQKKKEHKSQLEKVRQEA